MDIQWKDNKLTSASMLSRKGRSWLIRYNNKVVALIKYKGRNYLFAPPLMSKAGYTLGGCS